MKTARGLPDKQNSPRRTLRPGLRYLPSRPSARGLDMTEKPVLLTVDQIDALVELIERSDAIKRRNMPVLIARHRLVTALEIAVLDATVELLPEEVVR